MSSPLSSRITSERQRELLEQARAWSDANPDPATREELLGLVESAAFEELERRLVPIAFGTAGLRAKVGAGSGYMNQAVVRRTAFGIARYLLEPPAAQTEPPLVVVGFDARPTSRDFAEASAAVLLAQGISVLAFPAPAATPLVAFLARELAAALAIVVTASHNPRGDNGYKVYGSNAVQIIAPVDSAIAARIAEAPAARDIPCPQVSFDSTQLPRGLSLVTEELVQRYFDALTRALPRREAARSLRIVYTPLHGVGWAPLRRALGEAGFEQVEVVPEQAEPDGSFPTTAFPNPEEPGTLDLALSLGERRGAQLVIANDPDADRLAVAARLEGKLTVLDGNQLGALLADHALSGWHHRKRALVLSSVVSSPLVEERAVSSGAHYERTFTGFKWLWNAALSLEQEGAGEACFAYEEALGYSVFSGVRDKDGISAARALAEAAALLHARGLTLFDRLFELYERHGLWVSAARNIALSTALQGAALQGRLDRLATEPPRELNHDAVTTVTDYRRASEARRPWLAQAELLELECASGARVLIRPSGTEPKLKLYAHVRRTLTAGAELARELQSARSAAGLYLEELEEWLSQPRAEQSVVPRSGS